MTTPINDTVYYQSMLQSIEDRCSEVHPSRLRKIFARCKESLLVEVRLFQKYRIRYICRLGLGYGIDRKYFKRLADLHFAVVSNVGYMWNQGTTFRSVYLSFRRTQKLLETVSGGKETLLVSSFRRAEEKLKWRKFVPVVRPSERIRREGRELAIGQYMILPTVCAVDYYGRRRGHGMGVVITRTGISETGEKMYQVRLYDSGPTSTEKQELRWHPNEERSIGAIKYHVFKPRCYDNISEEALFGDDSNFARYYDDREWPSVNAVYTTLAALGGVEGSVDDVPFDYKQAGDSCSFWYLSAILHAKLTEADYANFQQIVQVSSLDKLMKSIQNGTGGSKTRKVALQIAADLYRMKKDSEEAGDLRTAQVALLVLQRLRRGTTDFDETRFDRDPIDCLKRALALVKKGRVSEEDFGKLQALAVRVDEWADQIEENPDRFRALHLRGLKKLMKAFGKLEDGRVVFAGEFCVPMCKIASSLWRVSNVMQYEAGFFVKLREVTMRCLTAGVQRCTRCGLLEDDVSAMRDVGAILMKLHPNRNAAPAEKLDVVVD